MKLLPDDTLSALSLHSIRGRILGVTVVGLIGGVVVQLVDLHYSAVNSEIDRVLERISTVSSEVDRQRAAVVEVQLAFMEFMESHTIGSGLEDEFVDLLDDALQPGSESERRGLSRLSVFSLLAQQLQQLTNDQFVAGADWGVSEIGVANTLESDVGLMISVASKLSERSQSAGLSESQLQQLDYQLDETGNRLNHQLSRLSFDLEHVNQRVVMARERHQREALWVNRIGPVVLGLILFALFLRIYRRLGVVSRIDRSLRQLSRGQLAEIEPVPGRDEISGIADALRQLVENTRSVSGYFVEMRNGNLQVSITPRSDQDEMLINLRETLSVLHHLVEEIGESTSAVGTQASRIATISDFLKRGPRIRPPQRARSRSWGSRLR
jgi:predicted RecB family endonuclease